MTTTQLNGCGHLQLGYKVGLEICSEPWMSCQGIRHLLPAFDSGNVHHLCYPFSVISQDSTQSFPSSYLVACQPRACGRLLGLYFLMKNVALALPLCWQFQPHQKMGLRDQ